LKKILALILMIGMEQRPGHSLALVQVMNISYALLKKLTELL